jgi:hypothetical protein
MSDDLGSPKGVQGVDVGEQRGEAVEEPGPVAAAQVVGRREAGEDLGSGGRDQVGQAERAARLHDEHGAQLPGPRVDVLEDRPVERAPVVEVVPARDPTALALLHPQHGQRLLRCRQGSAIGEAETVAEDAGACIQEGIAAHAL